MTRILFLVLAVVFFTSFQGASADPIAWNAGVVAQIPTGSQKEKVTSLLGEPFKKTIESAGEIWVYQKETESPNKPKMFGSKIGRAFGYRGANAIYVDRLTIMFGDETVNNVRFEENIIGIDLGGLGR